MGAFEVQGACFTNTPPTAHDDNYDVDQDMTLNVPLPGVLDNDSDPDADTLSAILVTGPANAQSFALNADGSFAYTPNPGFIGVDSFTYKANDGFSSDAKDIASGTLRLRSERSGTGPGRVYLILIVATDSSNNVSRTCLAVVVPKSQNQADIDAVNQLAAVARAACEATGVAPAGYFVVGDGPVVGPIQ